MNLPLFKVGDLAQLVKTLVTYWLHALAEVCGSNPGGSIINCTGKIVDDIYSISRTLSTTTLYVVVGHILHAYYFSLKIILFCKINKINISAISVMFKLNHKNNVITL